MQVSFVFMQAYQRNLATVLHLHLLAKISIVRTSSPKMNAVCSSETSISIYKSTTRGITTADYVFMISHVSLSVPRTTSQKKDRNFTCYVLHYSTAFNKFNFWETDNFLCPCKTRECIWQFLKSCEYTKLNLSVSKHQARFYIIGIR